MKNNQELLDIKEQLIALAKKEGAGKIAKEMLDSLSPITRISVELAREITLTLSICKLMGLCNSHVADFIDELYTKAKNETLKHIAQELGNAPNKN